MKKLTLSITSGAFLIISALFILPSNGSQLAFADSDQETTILVSESLKKNPLAMQIIAEMEAQKKKYKELSEESTPLVLPTREQIIIEENRKIAQEQLENDIKSMNKEYLDFTPRNAFEKFVIKLNETHHGIFWDQFDYLEAKVQLAIAAKNQVLEDGGSFYEAQREYFKYASMPRVEMISYIQELNLKYGFADKDIQSNFDANGKLPRFEDDKDAPCYGCQDLTSLSNSEGGEGTVLNVRYDPRSELKTLQEELSELRQQFLNETEIEEKKSIIDSLNSTVRKIQDLTYD